MSHFSAQKQTIKVRNAASLPSLDRALSLSHTVAAPSTCRPSLLPPSPISPPAPRPRSYYPALPSPHPSRSSVTLLQPPQRGIFPLDHAATCKGPMSAYLKCLKQGGKRHSECSEESKEYLKCRMDVSEWGGERESWSDVRRRCFWPRASVPLVGKSRKQNGNNANSPTPLLSTRTG